jgi:hypothetical protein
MIMGSIAERVGRLFSAFAPLDAYRLDVLGSITGIVTFSALSFAHGGPLAWSVVVAATLVALLWGETTRLVAASLVVLVAVGVVIGLRPGASGRPTST